MGFHLRLSTIAHPRGFFRPLPLEPRNYNDGAGWCGGTRPLLVPSARQRMAPADPRTLALGRWGSAEAFHAGGSPGACGQSVPAQVSPAWAGAPPACRAYVLRIAGPMDKARIVDFVERRSTPPV